MLTISLKLHHLIISKSLFSVFLEACQRVQTMEDQRCTTSWELRCRASEEERPSSWHGHGYQVVQCVRGQRGRCAEGLHRKGSLLTCRGTTFRVRSVPQCKICTVTQTAAIISMENWFFFLNYLFSWHRIAISYCLLFGYIFIFTRTKQKFTTYPVYRWGGVKGWRVGQETAGGDVQAKGEEEEGHGTSHLWQELCGRGEEDSQGKGWLSCKMLAFYF